MNDNVVEFHNRETRLFELPDGSKRLCRMDENYWWHVHYLYAVWGITEKEIANMALEELELQKISFNDAVQCIVAYLGNLSEDEASE